VDIESDCNPRPALDGLAAVSWQWGELWGFWNTPGNAHEIGRLGSGAVHSINSGRWANLSLDYSSARPSSKVTSELATTIVDNSL